ncbi:MAG: histidinol dehydrogenase [Alphaproteobacteria bacterium]|nr:histidinol dehydrogenase [Alphaproteobacteria bacterium]
MRAYELSDADVKKLCARKSGMDGDVLRRVEDIKRRVIAGGDSALFELNKELSNFNGALRVSSERIENATVSEELKAAIQVAASNIRKFHSSALPCRAEGKIETTPGVFCWREFRAIERVGLYVPGGTAPLFSTLLMLGIPADIAGCREIVVCSPPPIAEEILYVAQLLGINEIYEVGGAQAVFAMAYGTPSIAKVDKIFGPGNQYVMAAKMMASNDVAIDMPAGPSEVMVVADDAADHAFIAADILSQAEHGPTSQCVLVCDDVDLIGKVDVEIERQLASLSRAEIAAQALDNSYAILVDSIGDGISFINEYAPEHLIMQCRGWEKYLPLIQNAGSVFCGENVPESFGDYASGTNHTLPTSGFAKSFGGVSTISFGKWITFQTATREGFSGLSSIVETMAEAEGLPAHSNAVRIRRKRASA